MHFLIKYVFSLNIFHLLQGRCIFCLLWLSAVNRLFSHFFQDENRYSAGRGVHKNLKRAEKARILVGKIPSELLNYVHLI